MTCRDSQWASWRGPSGSYCRALPGCGWGWRPPVETEVGGVGEVDAEEI